MMSTRIRQATADDYEKIAALLSSVALPIAGVQEHLRHFLVAEDEAEVVGAIGLELYDDVGLLRSAVVTPSSQNRGVGSLLYESLIEQAKRLGVQRLILLTNTAEKYFEKKGFTTIDQNSVVGPIRMSVEFSEECPSHAACMELIL